MTVRALTLRCEPLEPEDTAARALERLRAQPLQALPVVAAGRVVGVVGEADLVRLAASGADRAALQSATVDQIARREVVSLEAGMSVEEAARALAEQDLAAAPVLDAHGAYLGMLRRSDLLGLYLGVEAPSPRSIAGMATPLGVRLVCGRIRAGAGWPGLLLAGAAMGALLFAALGLVNLACWAVESQWPQWPVFTMLVAEDSPATRAVFPYRGIWWLGATVAYVVVFLALMRLSPVSATHGAEHKVVHAIERGRPLTLEGVRPMPTVHPRCGTNLGAVLFVGVTGVLMMSELLPTIQMVLGQPGVATALVMLGAAILLARSFVGSWVQGWFTTREPGDRRLAAAIVVGEDLLRQYREHPQERQGLLGRLWMLGLPQVLVGLAATSYLLLRLAEWLHLGIRY